MTKDLETEIQAEVTPDEQALSSEPVDEPTPLSRDIVSKIVERERAKAYEKGKQEAIMQLQQQQIPQQQPENGMQQQQQAQPMQGQNIGGMQQMSPADIERLIVEKAPQMIQEQMKELVDNPEKMSSIILLSYTQPKLAQKKLMDLSNSIKTNQQALAEEEQARDPMSQLKPSTNAGVNDSAMSVADFRKMFR